MFFPFYTHFSISLLKINIEMEYIQPQISPKIRQKNIFGKIGKKSFFERFYVFCAFVFFFLRKK